ncbi:TRADD-N-associated membrane domain-containing protein [Streptomyces sp. AK02-04a]|uniref:TRADD-N-associated membrane domain-containing protein n=1 Tax=Streptomyces sp. AK02-04a TaxID=3028649 RepID=UPI0029AA7A01|nr:hypothetical protein [Streptomyces sp. AK02-04a]MDX3759043.1 hypothetical protein [Streptomyces sp. AK02-04a]
MSLIPPLLPRTLRDAFLGSDGTPTEAAETLSTEESARRRKAWRSSEEFSKLAKLRGKILFGIIPAALLGVLAYWLYTGKMSRIDAPRSAAAGAAIYLYGTIPLLQLNRKRARREFLDRVILGEALDELKQAEAEASESDVTFKSLWFATQKRLDYYHKIATTQAERSFLYGQVAASIGFLILLAAATFAAFARNGTASVVAGALGATAGGIGAYLGSTFLKMQERASAQLSDYFAQPLEFSKYLAAERLLSSLNGQDKALAVRDIISAISGIPNSEPQQAGQVENQGENGAVG